MTSLGAALLTLRDPLIVSLGQEHPIGDEVLAAAIVYRERLLDLLTQEIEALQVARARLLRQAGVPQ